MEHAPLATLWYYILMALGFLSGVTVVVISTTLTVFMEKFRDENDSVWQRRQLLFSLYAKQYQSMVFKLFNMSSFFWVASQFAASRVKYYEGQIEWLSAAWGGFIFLSLIYVWSCARSYKHSFDGKERGISKVISKAVMAASENNHAEVRTEGEVTSQKSFDELQQQLQIRDQKIHELEHKVKQLESILDGGGDGGSGNVGATPAGLHITRSSSVQIDA